MIYHLHKNGMGNITLCPNNYRKKYFISLIKQNMTDQYRQETNTIISNEDKFSMIKLCQVTDLNKTKDLYCNKIKSHFVRKCFIRLRLDKASTYSTLPINVCETCNKEMNTKHIIMECSKLENIRRKAFHEITRSDRNFKNMNKYDQLKYILNLPREDEAIIGIICSFVKSVCMHSKIIV